MLRYFCLFAVTLSCCPVEQGFAQSVKPVVPGAEKKAEENIALVGKWRWVDKQVVTVAADLTFKSGNGRKGTWKWKEGTERTYIVTWDDGLYVDEVTISQDGKSLSGRNNDKKKIKAERIE